ncbi:hypothetical protein SEA_ZUKO_103 [Streptomyces phage Zuko]|uniref:Uncharacterized protein n=1 Tax=Streptomyces phage Zuko TaxID=2601695 RepID=A0A5J6D7F2_9CAUD|nr:hypothetical protein PP630_gp103 [Streptomyces phage Zuko]QEQ93681.1 hypothetical protein SEA_ZUKO_103 [Streptomyces phage Zuko]
MTESINHLTADEARNALEEMITVLGCEGAASIAENFIEREAEKVTADIKDPKKKRGAELVIFRMILDKLEAAYAEELHVHETGEEPTYDAGPARD